MTVTHLTAVAASYRRKVIELEAHQDRDDDLLTDSHFNARLERARNLAGYRA